MQVRGFNRFVLEFILIVAGVLVALAVDDWRQSRVNLATEQYILEGIHADLQRDRADLDRTVSAAMGRIASADALLAALSTVPGVSTRLIATGLAEVPVQDGLLEELRSKYPPGSLTESDAIRLLVAPAAIQRLDVSSATFTEATASGELDRIRDIDLRSSLAHYYYNASLVGSTTDRRVEEQWVRLQAALASRGLPTVNPASGESELDRLRGDTALMAEIINARQFAIDQLIMNTSILESADGLAENVRAALD